MTDLSKLADAIESAIGKNAKNQEVTVWLDTGYPPLNMAISGEPDKGFPCGRIVEMFGPSACGKTAIATRAMISAQAAGGIAMWMDHERAFDLAVAQSMGLSDERGRWIYQRPETFEASVDTAVKIAKMVREGKLIKPEAPIVVVFDSLTSMIPQSKMFDNKGKAKGTTDYTMHDSMALAKACSACFPALVGLCEKYNILMLFVNQIRLKPGVVYGNPETTPGGNAPEYYSSLRLSLGKEFIKDKATKEVLGQIVRAKVVKNRMFRPWKTAEWNLMFSDKGMAFDVIGSMVELLAENGILERAGNGYIWTDGKKYMKPALRAKIETEGTYPDLLAMYLKAGIKSGETTPNADKGEEDFGLGDGD